jgi:hypothetical protein
MSILNYSFGSSVDHDVEKSAIFVFFFCVTLRPNVRHGLILEVSRSHTTTHHSRSVGILWTSDQLVAENSTWQHTTITTDKHPCPGGIRIHDLSRRAVLILTTFMEISTEKINRLNWSNKFSISCIILSTVLKHHLYGHRSSTFLLDCTENCAWHKKI